MPVTLTVSEVRSALYQHELLSTAPRTDDDAAERGSASNRLLGTLFHQTFAALVDGTADTGWHAALAGHPPDPARWREILPAHAYRRIVGPQFSHHESALQTASEPAWLYWAAVVELCDWICDLVWTLHQATGHMPQPGQVVNTECRLEAELRQPGWREPVRLTGLADAIWRPPGRDSWCVAELKLGRGHPEADLGQACLYHLLLRSQLGAGPSPGRQGTTLDASSGPGREEPCLDDSGALAVVAFQPRRVEQLYSSAQLEAAQSRLLDLIGRMAGVVDSTDSRPSAAEQPPPAAFEAAPGSCAAAGAGAGSEAVSGADSAAVSGVSSAASSGFSSAGRGSCAAAAAGTGSAADVREQGAALLWALAEYGAPAELAGEPIVGPTFVRFPLRPAAGVRIRKIEGLANEIRVRLELEQPPFIGSEGGQLVVDIQRLDRQAVLFSQIENQLPPVGPQGCSRLPVGVDLEGTLRFADLAEPDNCHLLVAGTTGSGKSEWLRSAIAGLLRTNTAATLRLLLIDPKRNAFNDLAESPLLWEPIVYPDERPVVDVLRRLVEEMERRYALMDGADTLQEHVDRSGAALPRIVCVCDEYLDLVNRGRKQRAELEEQIVRLGTKARAAGIHLILATQQPSREVIRGPLDANIPARVALRTNREIESRMVINEVGAERLLGQGDLLFKDIGVPRRLQGIYLPPDERKRLFSAGT